MKKVKDRFLKYVSFHTTSCEESNTSPSFAKEKLLGAYLAEELREMGLCNAHMDEHGYVYAFLPASGSDTRPALGLIAHMDTSPDVSGENINARTIKYTGGDIALSGKEIMRVSDFTFLTDYVGQDLIITDGTTLLGADDKAGIAEIVTLCEYLAENPQIKHRAIAVCFTPDEEIGRGTDHFDKDQFEADIAYTVDGGTLGEIEYENFNAASAKITIHGVNIHPGGAKNKMKNASLYACEFISMLPENEAPAHTQGYEGFYHVCSIKSDVNEAQIDMIIRDHVRNDFERRKDFIRSITAFLNDKYGYGTFEADITDSYYNMREKIEDCHMFLINDAVSAMEKAGVKPIVSPIRGGTDGARLSYEGIPCPNLSTGGKNYHSKYEFISIQSMEKMTEVLLNLVSE